MTDQQALSGLRVAEFGGGVGGAYCGRLLADCGAVVTVVEPEGGDPLRQRLEAEGRAETRGLLYGWLSAGKGRAAEAATALAGADLVILGEESGMAAADVATGAAVIDLCWFGKEGPYAGWTGSDIVVQALTGMMQLAGSPDEAPMFMGDCQAAMIGGLTAYVAALSALMGPGRGARFDVSILEANMALSELQLAYGEHDREVSQRYGPNRFKPNSPIGIYPCDGSWLGITALTPAQWDALCDLLRLDDLRTNPDFATGAQRHARTEYLEHRIAGALAGRTAAEWAAEFRKRRIPGVPVPNAQDILDHPAFAERQSLARFRFGGHDLSVPRVPFAMQATPTRRDLDAAAPEGRFALEPEGGEKPLSGLRIADFSMGWAGPLATRILADLGAEVLKIEAGRYPDWWRGTDWAPEAIAARQFEQARHFAALNRGKTGISLDLTRDAGRDIALRLVAGCDAVVENQAAGVLDKLGLGYAALRDRRPDVVMMSMSAFGLGNSFSDTRAYGSTLEQGSGLPRFAGRAEDPPSMAHLAYGDAVGGLYGCAGLLTALVHRRRTGQGQFLNLSMVECMMMFTAPAVLSAQVTGAEPPRRGNRHVAMAPHGAFAAAGADAWVAVAVPDDAAFARLAALLGQDWHRLDTLHARQAAAAELEAALTDWTAVRDARAAVEALQAAGIAAAPVLAVHEVTSDPQLTAAGFFVDIDRPHSGPQRQCGLAFGPPGRRFHANRPAPELGQDTRRVLAEALGIGDAGYDALLRDGVVTTRPTALRGAAPAPSDTTAGQPVT
jgi:crotonobetainyl-CoA:carnitine CoA-transferase CaiB-like acyl-CoA transferase